MNFPLQEFTLLNPSCLFSVWQITESHFNFQILFLFDKYSHKNLDTKMWKSNMIFDFTFESPLQSIQCSGRAKIFFYSMQTRADYEVCNHLSSLSALKDATVFIFIILQSQIHTKDPLKVQGICRTLSRTRLSKTPGNLRHIQNIEIICCPK